LKYELGLPHGRGIALWDRSRGNEKSHSQPELICGRWI
jgi:hypothetical protein